MLYNYIISMFNLWGNNDTEEELHNVTDEPLPKVTPTPTVTSLAPIATTSTGSVLIGLSVMKNLINANTIQFYKGEPSIANASTVNESVNWMPVFADEANKKKFISEFNDDLKKYNAPNDITYDEATKMDKNEFVNRIIKKPLDVFKVINKNKYEYNGSKFVEKNGSSDPEKFLDLLAYYLNINNIYQHLFNALHAPIGNTTNPSGTTSSNTLLTYKPSPLQSSNFDVQNFKPWNQFGTNLFSGGSTKFPFGGDLLPSNMGSGPQYGGSGEACGARIKRVVDSVIATAGNVDADVKKTIDVQLENNIKYETLINQKLQQIVTISRTSPSNNGEVAKYLTELQSLVEFLTKNQNLLFSTLRMSVSPSLIAKIPSQQTQYRSLADQITAGLTLGGGNGVPITQEQFNCLLAKVNGIAAKLGVQ